MKLKIEGNVDLVLAEDTRYLVQTKDGLVLGFKTQPVQNAAGRWEGKTTGLVARLPAIDAEYSEAIDLDFYEAILSDSILKKREKRNVLRQVVSQYLLTTLPDDTTYLTQNPTGIILAGNLAGEETPAYEGEPRAEALTLTLHEAIVVDGSLQKREDGDE